MKAEIIAIGSELVSGQSLDTNSQWLSQALHRLGIPVHFHATLGDDLAENLAGFRVALGRSDLIVVTGGLGPTQDDLTRQVVAEIAGVGLVEDAASLAWIESMFARRNRVMTDRNQVQALFPEGSEPLPNAIGTAPGIGIRVGRSLIACLPGVPREMKLMFDAQVIPWLKRSGVATRTIVHRKINLFGKGESEVEAQAMDLTARGRVPEVGITASETTISFRVSAEGESPEAAALAMGPTLAIIQERFADLIVGEGSDDVAEATVRELIRTGRTIASTEACTGGTLARYLTAVPGSGPNYLGGLVASSAEAQENLLALPPGSIVGPSMASPEVAGELARRVRERFGADLGLALTGFVAQGQGTPADLVGQVYLGLATADKVQARKLELGPEQPREVIQRRAAKQALNWARLILRPLEDRPVAWPSDRLEAEDLEVDVELLADRHPLRRPAVVVEDEQGHVIVGRRGPTERLDGGEQPRPEGIR